MHRFARCRLFKHSRAMLRSKYTTKVRNEVDETRKKVRLKKMESVWRNGGLQSFLLPLSLPDREGAEPRREWEHCRCRRDGLCTSVGGWGWLVTSRKMQQGAAMQGDEAKLGGTGPVGLRQPSAICWIAPLYGSRQHRHHIFVMRFSWKSRLDNLSERVWFVVSASYLNELWSELMWKIERF